MKKATNTDHTTALRVVSDQFSEGSKRQRWDFGQSAGVSRPDLMSVIARKTFLPAAGESPLVRTLDTEKLRSPSHVSHVASARRPARVAAATALAISMVLASADPVAADPPGAPNNTSSGVNHHANGNNNATNNTSSNSTNSNSFGSSDADKDRQERAEAARQERAEAAREEAAREEAAREEAAREEAEREEAEREEAAREEAEREEAAREENTSWDLCFKRRSHHQTPSPI